ncbi:hypothetical protein Ancab_009904 [Ancistrocladus abbreviatus]
MKTLRQLSPPTTDVFGTPATGMDSINFDVDKARTARRKRLEIRKMRSSPSSFQPDNGVVEVDSFNRKRSSRKTEALLTPSPSSTSPSSYPDSSSENFEDEEESVTCASHGSESIIGRRREMEDAVKVEIGFAVVDSGKYDFFSVYDGHSGARVAEACRERMHRILEKEIQEEVAAWKMKKNKVVVEAMEIEEVAGGAVVDWEKVMARCYEKMDREVGGGEEEVEEMTVGSTAVMAVVGKEEVVVANCGDSRAVMCRGGVAVPLSVDHKPDRPDELARIEAAGGRVINWNGPRVLGVLATSRSIGDHYLRPYVISKPDVTVCKRTKEDEFLMLATDGLWDVITNEVACRVVRKCLNGRIRRGSREAMDRQMAGSQATRAAAILVELAIARGSRDNISVVVVQLRKSKKSTYS